jgi:hypothetical protein
MGATYDVYIRPKGSADSWTLQGTTSTKSFTITGLEPEVEYDVQVIAKNASGTKTAPEVALATSAIASGGTASTITIGSSPYIVRRFTSSGTLTLNTAAEVEYLIVGGGGGGGGDEGGGGGAGGYITNVGEPELMDAGTYSVTVGAGGSGAAVNALGGDGGDSAVFGITAAGGGGGGGSTPGGLNGRPGGSVTRWSCRCGWWRCRWHRWGRQFGDWAAR